MTLNRVISLYFALFQPNSVDLEADYVKVVEDRLTMFATEM